jgi:hypothetical protein
MSPRYGSRRKQVMAPLFDASTAPHEEIRCCLWARFDSIDPRPRTFVRHGKPTIPTPDGLGIVQMDESRRELR